MCSSSVQPIIGLVRLHLYIELCCPVWDPDKKTVVPTRKKRFGHWMTSEKFLNCIVSLTVRIPTDHKPLVSNLNDISSDRFTMCAQRFRLCMLKFTYTVYRAHFQER